jgi:hypothetical protein
MVLVLLTFVLLSLFLLRFEIFTLPEVRIQASLLLVVMILIRIRVNRLLDSPKLRLLRDCVV